MYHFMDVYIPGADSYSQMWTGYQSAAPQWQGRQERERSGERSQRCRISQASEIQESAASISHEYLVPDVCECTDEVLTA